MRAFASLLIGAAILATGPAQAAPRPADEARLARALAGRVAGEPVNCIDLRRVRSSRIIDRTAIIYDAGGTLYVNRPRAGRESLNNWDAMVSRPFGSRLCSIDTVNLIDQGSGFYGGTVFLGEFVPYRRFRN